MVAFWALMFFRRVPAVLCGLGDCTAIRDFSASLPAFSAFLLCRHRPGISCNVSVQGHLVLICEAVGPAKYPIYFRESTVLGRMVMGLEKNPREWRLWWTRGVSPLHLPCKRRWEIVGSGICRRSSLTFRSYGSQLSPGASQHTTIAAQYLLPTRTLRVCALRMM